MTVSLLAVDGESDVTELYRQRFRREVRQGTCAMRFASSGADALSKLTGGVEPTRQGSRHRQNAPSRACRPRTAI